MAIHLPDEREQRAEIQISAHPLYARERASAEAFVVGLRRADAPEDYYQLHRDLLGRCLGCQRFLERCAAELVALRGTIGDLKSANESIAKIRPVSRRIAGVQYDERAAKAVLSLYRTLGDALVWRVLGYRRAVITALGDAPPVRRLASGAGLESEIEEIVWLWEEKGTFAVHTDITNCIRHGDVLSVEHWEPLEICLTEVKASKDVDDASPQMQRLARVTHLANTGFHPEAAEGGPLWIDNSGIAYRTHHEVLADLVALARTNSYVWREIEDGLVIEVYDEANPAGLSRDHFDGRRQEMRAALSSWDEDDLLRYSASGRRLRDRHYTFPSLAPLALFPLGAGDTADLVVGRLDFVTTLNAALLEERLSRTGLTAAVARGKNAYETFLRAERAGYRITVPAVVREQLMIELMTIETLTETLDWFLSDSASRQAGRPAVALAYTGEAGIWGSQH